MNPHPNDLSAAPDQGHRDLVQLLLNLGADPNIWSQIWEHGSALIAAARAGHNAIVSFFLESGADVHLGDLQKRYATALIAAVNEGHTESVRILLRAGADVNARSKEFKHPLIVAAIPGHEVAVEPLLEAGAKLEKQDLRDLKDPDTLGAAIDLGNIELLQVVLDCGVNVTVEDSHRWALYRVAWTNGYTGICDLLSAETATVAQQDQNRALRSDWWIKREGGETWMIQQDGLKIITGQFFFSARIHAMMLTPFPQRGGS